MANLAREVVAGREATVAYLDAIGGSFVSPEEAKVVIVVFDDGEKLVLFPESATMDEEVSSDEPLLDPALGIDEADPELSYRERLSILLDWDEDLHPRDEKGQFVEKGGGSWSPPDGTRSPQEVIPAPPPLDQLTAEADAAWQAFSEKRAEWAEAFKADPSHRADPELEKLRAAHTLAKQRVEKHAEDVKAWEEGRGVNSDGTGIVQRWQDGPTAYAVNDALRGRGGDVAKVQQAIDQLDAIAANNRLEEPTTLYRVVKLADDAAFSADFLDKGFPATTRDPALLPKIAKMVSRSRETPVMVEIDVPAGVGHIDMNALRGPNPFDWIQEVVLPRGLTYQVVSKPEPIPGAKRGAPARRVKVRVVPSG